MAQLPQPKEDITARLVAEGLYRILCLGVDIFGQMLNKPPRRHK